MKPYGREKKVMQNPQWKKDYHLHENSKKLLNWWEAICDNLSRTTIKRKTKREIEEQMYEQEDENN